jgi:hypothetical protein
MQSGPLRAFVRSRASLLYFSGTLHNWFPEVKNLIYGTTVLTIVGVEPPGFEGAERV